MWKLCKYKHALGIPGKGLHSYRLCNLAIVDIILTFLGARIIQIMIFPEYNYYLVLVALFFIGIIMHRIFCVRTTIDKLLFS